MMLHSIVESASRPDPGTLPPTGNEARQHYDVVIPGDGFAGAALARRLERKLPDNRSIAVISRENFNTCNPPRKWQLPSRAVV